MPDDMRRRRELVARAFIMRRHELGLTQEQVAQLAGIVGRTVSNFENGRWPNAKTRALLEDAVGWPPGEIQRQAAPKAQAVDPELLELASELSDDQAEWMIQWLEGVLGQRRGGARRRANG